VVCNPSRVAAIAVAYATWGSEGAVNQTTRSRLCGPAHRRRRPRPARDHPSPLDGARLERAILDAYDRGASLAEIAEATGMPVPAVHRVVILRSARR
jgi:hypothetical protein